MHQQAVSAAGPYNWPYGTVDPYAAQAGWAPPPGAMAWPPYGYYVPYPYPAYPYPPPPQYEQPYAFGYQPQMAPGVMMQPGTGTSANTGPMINGPVHGGPATNMPESSDPGRLDQ
mmetsp:Transcript_16287/g.18118  ORF Transcript_16287/g.18118 Transcript_16287/m.18118 type:complete len:115 (+) Transcript_16287:531-875(+)